MIKQLVTVTGVAMSLLISSQVHGAGIDDSYVDEPVVIYGGGLINDSQAQSLTEQILNADDVENIDYVNAEDVKRYINQDYDTNVLKSSVKVTPKSSGSGIHLEINEDLGDITDVTELAYENALLTAGIYDADVVIGASSDVTGESALTGIYKAYEVMDGDVDTQATRSAQDELSVITDIENEHAEHPDYSSEQLNHIVIDVKLDVAENHSDGDGVNVTEDDIRSMVEEKIDENELNDVLNDSDINELTRVIHNAVQQETFSESNADRLKSAGNDLAERIQDSNVMDKISEADRNMFQRMIDSIVDWFRNIFS